MDKRKKQTENKKSADKICEKGSFRQESHNDPLGSYTGNPTVSDKPEQDADDL